MSAREKKGWWTTWSWQQWKRNGGGHYAHAVREGRERTACGCRVGERWEVGDKATPATVHCAACRAALWPDLSLIDYLRRGGDLVEDRELGRDTLSEFALLRQRPDMMAYALARAGWSEDGGEPDVEDE